MQPAGSYFHINLRLLWKSYVTQGHSHPYSASLVQTCPIPRSKVGRQMIKMFRNKSPLVGTFPVAVKEKGFCCRNDQPPSRVESHRDVSCNLVSLCVNILEAKHEGERVP